jgi:hypothetical protein
MIGMLATPRFQRDLPRDGVQPGADQFGMLQLGRFARQQDERRLHGIFDVCGLAKDATANAPNHRCVPTHQGRERSLIAMADEFPH